MLSWPATTFVLLLLSRLDSPEDQRKTLPAGDWGGDQVSLVVTEKGARLELACAHGSIETAILLDEDGRFDVTGTFSREGPGPVRVDDEKGEPARFSGRVAQGALTLTVVTAARSRTIGTFELEKGRASRIRKCQ